VRRCIRQPVIIQATGAVLAFSLLPLLLGEHSGNLLHQFREALFILLELIDLAPPLIDLERYPGKQFLVFGLFLFEPFFLLGLPGLDCGQIRIFIPGFARKYLVVL
jgi:hypothetical protein